MSTHPRLPLLSDVGIIALVPDRWGIRWQARHHIASRLAQYFHVVWVDCPPTWEESLRGLLHPAKSRELGNVPANLQIIQNSPWSPNLGRPAFLRTWITRARLRDAAQRLRSQGCSKIVLYLWRPYYADSLDLIKHDLACYHIDDEYSFSAVEKEIDAEELQLIRRVDQLFVHSHAMMEKKGILTPSSQLIPNGVDFRKYSTPAAEPADLQSIPRPRIGYTGNLKKVLDWSLILQLSRMHPEWSFVFVGRMLPQPEVQAVEPELSKQANIHLMGPRPTELIASYVQHIDVCIMPYKMNDYTKYIYPLKLHEYLATGNPVVGTPIPCLREFGDVVLLADGVQQWSEMIARALSSQERHVDRRTARQQAAARYDWDVIVRQLAQTLAHRLGYTLPSAPIHGEDFQQASSTCSSSENPAGYVVLSKP